MARHGYGATETERAYQRAHELLAVTGRDPRIFGVLHGLCALYGTQANLARVSDYAEELLDRALRSGDSAAICVGHRCIAIGHNWQGDFTGGLEHAMEAARHYDETAHGRSAQEYGHDIGVAALMHAAMAAWFLGRLGQSRETADEAQSIAEDLAHPNTLAYSYLWAAFTRLAARDMSGARRISESMLSYCEARGMPTWAAVGRCMLGAAETVGEEIESALGQLRSGMETLDRLHYRLLRPTFLCFEAEGLAKLGQYDAALARMDNALKIAAITRERWWEAELHRVKAEVQTQTDVAPREVEAGYVRAIESARSQRAKFLELRAATSLAGLWRDEGKRDRSRSVLESVYSHFSEEFNSPDLMNAKALMEELSA
jgi:predicted ATPase